MFSLLNNPAFQHQTEAAILEFCKDVRQITYIEHGADNIVALVNEEYVFRFPRNPDAAMRLTFETALLQKIGNTIQAVSIPHLAKVHRQPLYTVSHYIAGEHMTGAQIQLLTEEEQVALGKKIAEFIAQLNQSVSSLEVQRLRTAAGVDTLRERWDVYFERLFVTEPLPNEKLRPIVAEYYAIWRDYVSREQYTYAIHDDLHVNNLLFVGTQLNGVVDFSETNVGSIEEELRWLYPMGDVVLRSAIFRYQELTGNTVDQNHIRVWVVVQELAAYIKRLSAQDTESPHFLRAQEYLRKWIANFPL
jgi:aminoglycoside 2''-phosphotransferase